MLHSFDNHVAWCCMMLDDVEQSLISVKHCLQHHPTFVLFWSVNKNVAFVWPLCLTLLNVSNYPLSWLCGYFFPWQWFTVYTCSTRSAWMLRYSTVNEESFQSLSEETTTISLQKEKAKQPLRTRETRKPENCSRKLLSKYETGNLGIDKFLLLRGIVELQ